MHKNYSSSWHQMLSVPVSKISLAPPAMNKRADKWDLLHSYGNRYGYQDGDLAVVTDQGTNTTYLYEYSSSYWDNSSTNIKGSVAVGNKVYTIDPADKLQLSYFDEASRTWRLVSQLGA